ncbi:hypothetical protein E4U53_004326 [Claviceps sorghi]|nr:hypothetical protein E4U53_004326 [Claviceps sorghi]
MFGAKLIGLVAAVAVAVVADEGHKGERVISLPGPFRPDPLFKQGPQTKGCTYTVYTAHPWNLGPTRTLYTTTTTTTDGVNCGVCDHVTAKPFPDGPGPVAHFTTTIVAATPTTVEAFTCESHHPEPPKKTS